MRGKGTLSMLTLVLAVAALAATAPPAEACMRCICTEDGRICICDASGTVTEAGDLELFDPVVVSFPEVNRAKPTRAEISVYGYQTTDIRNGFTCVVAMPTLPGVKSVDSVTNLNTLTGEPLEHVTFAPISVPGQEFGRMGYDAGVGETDGSWVPFVSNITGRVENGIPNHFTIEVTLDGELTAQEFVQTLRRQGGLFTASSDQLGFPDGGHTYLKRFQDFSVMALYPALVKKPERGTRLAPVLP